jgi:hypothetical protein
MFLLSHPPRWLLALDKTTEYFLAAWDAGRSCQREVRAAVREELVVSLSESVVGGDENRKRPLA